MSEGKKYDTGKPAAVFNYNKGKSILLHDNWRACEIYTWVGEISHGRNIELSVRTVANLLRGYFPKLQLASSVSDCYVYGANKYGRNNYTGVSLSRYASALVRHLDAYFFKTDDNINDDESGIHHIKHAFANLLIMLEIIDDMGIHGDFDLFKEFTEKD